MDLNEILSKAGVSNEVVKDAGVIKSDESTKRAKQPSREKTYPLGINHADRLFYGLFSEGVVWDQQFNTFLEAKEVRDTCGLSGVKIISVTEVDYI